MKTNNQEYKARAAVSAEPFEGPWAGLVGCDIEVYDDGIMADWGRVDTITGDGKILWLEQDGVRSRRIVEVVAGRAVFIMVPEQGTADRSVEGNRADPM